MLQDLVIDTNVLAHAQDPREKRRRHACALIDMLLNGSIELCVDEGFAIDEGSNRSFIGREYLDHIRHGSIAFILIIRLAQKNRIKVVEKRLERRRQQRVDQLIRNKTDRIFVGVAGNSISKVLVSHDHVDLATQKRRTLEKEVGIGVVEADECCRLCEEKNA